jgi:hypothetical protein
MTQSMVAQEIREFLVAFIARETGETNPVDVTLVWTGIGRGAVAYRSGRASRMIAISGADADAVHAIEEGPTTAQLAARAGLVVADLWRDR